MINISEITPFGEMDALSPPGSKTLVKRKAWGGFWRSLYRKVAIFTETAYLGEIHMFSPKSAHFTKIPRFRANGDLAVKGTSKHQYFLRNIDGFEPGAKESPFSSGNRKNMKIMVNH